MPFYDESGKAIITTQTRKEYQAPEPKPVVVKPSTPKTSSSSSSSRPKPKATIAPVIQDFKSGITPVERQIIDQAPLVSTITQEQRKQIDASKLAFVRTITGHGKENIPEVVRDLGPSAEKDYAITAYKTQTGVVPYEEGIKKIQSDFETRLITGSKPTSIRWMKEHGTFTSEGKEYSWSELKKKHPRLEIDRYGGEFIISEKPIDYAAWRKEQYKDMNPIAATVRRGAATLLGGFASFDYMRDGHTGDPTNVKAQQKKLDAVIDKWEYDTTHNIESGNVIGAISNIPAVTNVLAPYGLGVGVGAVFKGVHGASSLLASKGFKYTASALKGGARATGIGLGALAIGTAGYDVYTTHQQDSDKALTKALTYGTQFFSFGRGMKAGSKIKLPERKIDITHFKLTGQPEYMVGRKYFELLSINRKTPFLQNGDLH